MFPPTQDIDVTIDRLSRDLLKLEAGEQPCKEIHVALLKRRIANLRQFRKEQLQARREVLKEYRDFVSNGFSDSLVGSGLARLLVRAREMVAAEQDVAAGVASNVIGIFSEHTQSSCTSGPNNFKLNLPFMRELEEKLARRGTGYRIPIIEEPGPPVAHHPVGISEQFLMKLESIYSSLSEQALNSRPNGVVQGIGIADRCLQREPSTSARALSVVPDTVDDKLERISMMQEKAKYAMKNVLIAELCETFQSRRSLKTKRAKLLRELIRKRVSSNHDDKESKSRSTHGYSRRSFLADLTTKIKDRQGHACRLRRVVEELHDRWDLTDIYAFKQLVVQDLRERNQSIEEHHRRSKGVLKELLDYYASNVADRAHAEAAAAQSVDMLRELKEAIDWVHVQDEGSEWIELADRKEWVVC